jgi:hypothetical protein
LSVCGLPHPAPHDLERILSAAPPTLALIKGEARDRRASERGPAMGDVVFVLLSVGFFALSWLFVRLCERV